MKTLSTTKTFSTAAHKTTARARKLCLLSTASLLVLVGAASAQSVFEFETLTAFAVRSAILETGQPLSSDAVAPLSVDTLALSAPASITITPQVYHTPEPSSIALIATGIGGLMALRRFKKGAQ